MGRTNRLSTLRALGLERAQACDLRTNGRDIFNELFDFDLIAKVRALAVRTATEFDFDLFVYVIGFGTVCARVT
jgi:hypothetical protein